MRTDSRLDAILQMHVSAALAQNGARILLSDPGSKAGVFIPACKPRRGQTGLECQEHTIASAKAGSSDELCWQTNQVLFLGRFGLSLLAPRHGCIIV
jgi:hypothetical protein